MAWYLNFCAPFDLKNQLYRRLILAQIVIQLFMILFFKCLKQTKFPMNQNDTQDGSHQKEGIQSNQPKIQNQQQSNKDGSSGQQVSEIASKHPQEKNKWNICVRKFGNLFFCFDKFPYKYQEFNTFTTIFFGQHTIGVIFAAMYCPFLIPLIMTWCYLLLTIIMAILQAFQFDKAVRVVWVLMCILNISLMQSGLIGLGASGYDNLNLQCYGEIDL